MFCMYVYGFAGMLFAKDTKELQHTTARMEEKNICPYSVTRQGRRKVKKKIKKTDMKSICTYTAVRLGKINE